MNPFEFVIAVLVILLVFTLIRHKMGIPVRSIREMRDGGGHDVENAKLRGQVKTLQERINVLERIVTDRGADTAAQIEALRESEQIAKGGDE